LAFRLVEKYAKDKPALQFFYLTVTFIHLCFAVVFVVVFSVVVDIVDVVVVVVVVFASRSSNL